MPWHKFFKYQSTPGISGTYNTRIVAQFAETENVIQRLFADQGKQTSVFHFCCQETNGSLPFPVSVCSKRTEVAVFQ
jgi:hypothetical protein